MSRINTNVDSLVALNNLNKTNKSLGTTLTRLSTGVKVNSGKDDPAGLISGEFLRQEISSISSAIQNNNRANNVISTADSALGEISNLLDNVRGIITSTANSGVLSQEEIEANQDVVDSALQSVNRIAANTQFAGKKLLDGSFGFQLSGVGSFDSGSSTFTDVNVNSANFNANGDAITVDVQLATAATQASLTLAETGNATADSTIEVVGNLGSAIVKIGTGQDIEDAINSVSDVTGVQATDDDSGVLNSTGYGENSFVSVRNITGGVITDSEVSDQGTNAVGTINGQNFSSSGLNASLKTANLDVNVTFSAGATAGTTSFQITGGGARFQLGQEVNQNNQVTVGIGSFSAASLGHNNATDGDRTLSSIASGGTNALTADRALVAADIVKEAISQVATQRAKLGSLQSSTIETNLNALQVSLENVSAARSNIVDTDFAAETANLTRLQVLAQAGTSALSIANSRPQGVLSLLG
jgi:flagellin